MFLPGNGPFWPSQGQLLIGITHDCHPIIIADMPALQLLFQSAPHRGSPSWPPLSPDPISPAVLILTPAFLSPDLSQPCPPSLALDHGSMVQPQGGLPITPAQLDSTSQIDLGRGFWG